MDSVNGSVGDLQQPAVGEALVHLEQVQVGGDGAAQQAVVPLRLGGVVQRARGEVACARAAAQRRRTRAPLARTPRALRKLVSGNHTKIHTNTHPQ